MKHVTRSDYECTECGYNGYFKVEGVQIGDWHRAVISIICPNCGEENQIVEW